MVIIITSCWLKDITGSVRRDKVHSSHSTACLSYTDAVAEMKERKALHTHHDENPYKVVKEVTDIHGDITYLQLEAIHADDDGDKRVKVFCVAETFANKCDLLCSC